MYDCVLEPFELTYFNKKLYDFELNKFDDATYVKQYLAKKDLRPEDLIELKNMHDLFIEQHVEMEVHADINTDPQLKSNDALKEAMGYILGMGFAFKAKPEAYASSCCADKAVN